jgi:hypothetical protein
MIIAYDSASPRNIPAYASAIFPWADGRYAWSHRMFPRAGYRYITAGGDPEADIADFEPGCVWPGSALRKWAEDRKDWHPTSDLTVYVDRDNFTLAKDVLTGFVWHLFLATQDGTAPPTYGDMACRAVQTTDHADLYDVDHVFDEGWLNQP